MLIINDDCHVNHMLKIKFRMELLKEQLDKLLAVFTRRKRRSKETFYGLLLLIKHLHHHALNTAHLQLVTDIGLFGGIDAGLRCSRLFSGRLSAVLGQRRQYGENEQAADESADFHWS